MMSERKIILGSFSEERKLCLGNNKDVSKTDSSNSKGVRLNWTSLNEVKPIVLSNELTVGKSLNADDLSKRNNNSLPNNILVP